MSIKLSVLIPVYNEASTLLTIISRVMAQRIEGIDETELIIVDDASTDGTTAILQAEAKKHPDTIVAIYESTNRGKGCAIRTSLQYATGHYVILQDADLEYDPVDYEALLQPLLSKQADVVFGSRFLNGSGRRCHYLLAEICNRFSTWVNNMLTNLQLSDVCTCLIATRLDIMKSIPLRSNGFALNVEMASKFAR